jgi:hypothetical protein
MRPLCRLSCKGEDIIKIDVKEIVIMSTGLNKSAKVVSGSLNCI